jgi:hypothetical protein
MTVAFTYLPATPFQRRLQMRLTRLWGPERKRRVPVATITNYVPTARSFLDNRFGDGPANSLWIRPYFSVSRLAVGWRLMVLA